MTETARIVASVEAEDMATCEYEELRRKNLEDNKRILAELGLSNPVCMSTTYSFRLRLFVIAYTSVKDRDGHLSFPEAPIPALCSCVIL